jgi:hypothetical protein
VTKLHVRIVQGPFPIWGDRGEAAKGKDLLDPSVYGRRDGDIEHMRKTGLRLHLRVPLPGRKLTSEPWTSPSHQRGFGISSCEISSVESLPVLPVTFQLIRGKNLYRPFG